MKKAALILTAIVTVGIFTLVMAQNTMQKTGRGQRMEHLKKELNLSDQQEKQFQTMMEGFRQEMEALKDDASISREQKQEQFQVLREKHLVQMKNVLDESQQSKFEKLMADRPSHRGLESKSFEKGRGGRPDPVMIEKIIQRRVEFDKELTEGEKAIIEEYRQKLEKFMASHSGKSDEEMMRSRHDGRQDRGMEPFDKEEMKPLIQIARNHENSLRQIMTDMRPAGMERTELEKSGPGMENGEQQERMGRKHAIRFLLMDPEKEMVQAKQGDDQVLVYPNPAGNVVNVQVNLESAQPVKIELLNKIGNVNRVLFESGMPAGKQVKQFNIEQLPSNEIYFVKTTISSKTISVKLMKK